jgi:two-component system OmpR family response regulator
MVKAKQRVFVVDDEEEIADVLSSVLREADFEVETFYGARPAMRRAHECPPDILVTDIVMPDMDGIMLAEAVLKQNPNCRVILMSGNPEWKSLGSFHDDIGFALLKKPFPFSQLLQLVKPDHK